MEQKAYKIKGNFTDNQIGIYVGVNLCIHAGAKGIGTNIIIKSTHFLNCCNQQ